MKRLCLVGCCAIVALSLLSPAAGASPHPFRSVFAVGTPFGESTLPFADPCGSAVAPDGRVFVADYYHSQIASFDSDGAYLGAIPTAGCGLAVDAGGDLLVNRLHGPVVRLGSDAGVIDPARSTGVAVDPVSDDVYVTHRDRVDAYAAPALPGDTPTSIGAGGALTDAYGAAVSGFAGTLGFLYVADAGDDTVKIFDPATDTANPIATIDGSEVPLGGFRDLSDGSLAIDDSDGHLFVIDNLQPGFVEPVAAVYEFDAAGKYVGQLPRQIVHGGPSGLAVDNRIDPGSGKPRGIVYVTSGNQLKMVSTPDGQVEVGGVIDSFCPAPSAASASGCPSTPYPESRTLRVSKPGTGVGSVTSFLPGVSEAGQLEIDCATICATEFDQGTQLTLIATPRPHSAFTGWNVAGQPSACPSTGTCKLTISADTEVAANFTAIPQETLSVTRTGSGSGVVTSSPAGIECGATCQSGFDRGSTVTLTAEANAGSEFTGWSGGGCSGTGVCRVSMGSDQAVGAEFRAIPKPLPVDRGSGVRTLAISISGEGAGTITSDPAGIECGTPCSSVYSPGSKVTLRAEPDEESAFTGWSGCDSQAGTTCTVTLGSSRTVNASFGEAVPLELAGVSLRGAKALLSVVVPGRGTLQARANQLRPVSVKARKAETLTLPLLLRRAAKKALAKKGKLEVKVALTFKPASQGAPRALEKTIVFRGKGGRR